MICVKIGSLPWSRTPYGYEAGLAFVTKETDLYKAFLIGMSLPSFLNATGQFVSSSRLPGNTSTQNTSTTETRINNNSGGWGEEFLDLFFV